MRCRRRAVLAMAVAGACVATSAAACPMLVPLGPDVVAHSPVVARGTITGIVLNGRGDAVLMVEVHETYRGTEARTWYLVWPEMSPVGAPETLEAFAAAYGELDIVFGLMPDLGDVLDDAFPDRVDAARGFLQHEMCGEPFVGGHAAMEPVLREHGLIE